jgi:hypothetical protein
MASPPSYPLRLLFVATAISLVTAALVVSEGVAAYTSSLSESHNFFHSRRQRQRRHKSFSLHSKRSDDDTPENKSNKPKVLVLGGSGFVGQHVTTALRQKNIPFIATRRSDKEKDDDTMITLDVTSETATQQVIDLCTSNQITTIISTIGSIFTENDYQVNAASGQIASALQALRSSSSQEDDNVQQQQKVVVTNFVFIGNSNRIRNVCNIISNLQEYGKGKEESERLIQYAFQGGTGVRHCIIRPTFIYGGDKFSFNPPRLPTKIGAIIEALLGLYPIQSLCEILPDVLGVALEAPVNVETVATAIVNLVIGLEDSNSLDTNEDIIMAASRRYYGKCDVESEPAKTRREELKLCLSQHAKEYTPEENFAMLEELELLKPITTRPTDDTRLNGRWDFCFDVEPDVGTGFIKELFEGDDDEGFRRRIIDFRGVHMQIGNEQSTIQLVVSVALFRKPITVILHTSLTPASINPEGTMFKEKFEGIEVNGIRLWYPNAWKKSRYLEFSYLDDAFAVARGSGGEAHFLLRGGG